MLLDIPEDESILHKLQMNKNHPWQFVARDKDLQTKIEAQLQDSEISDLYPMRAFLKSVGKEARFNNEVYIVLFTNGLKAVLKPKTEEDQESVLGEVIAYKCAQHLASSLPSFYCLIPPTVVRTYGGFKGSLQWYVESPYDLWRPEDHAEAFKKLNPYVSNLASLFLFIFGQWDRHPGNYLVTTSSETTEENDVALIDNEGIINCQIVLGHQHPFVRIGYEKDTSLLDSGPHTLKEASLEDVHQVFKGTVPLSRLQSLHKTFFEKSDAQDGSKVLTYLFKNGFPWIQYHGTNPKAYPLAACFSLEDQRAYDTFTLANLKDLFSPLMHRNVKRFSEEFLSHILERRKILKEAFS